MMSVKTRAGSMVHKPKEMYQQNCVLKATIMENSRRKKKIKEDNTKRNSVFQGKKISDDGNSKRQPKTRKKSNIKQQHKIIQSLNSKKQAMLKVKTKLKSKKLNA